ncbi:Fc.00g045660.m01.CDS01 [Cosmosporella sp. VM-42]
MGSFEDDNNMSTASTGVASPVPDGGWLAWLQVAGSFCLYFCTWGLISSFGTFQTIYEDEKLQLHTPFQISVIGSLQTFLMVFLGFIVGPIYDAGHFRYLLSVGSFLIIIGTVLQSLCTRYWQYLLAQGSMIGIGAGCLSILSVAITSQWFTTQLPLANGFAASGSGLGGVLLPIMTRELHSRVGLPWAVRTMALLLLVVLGFANIVLQARDTAPGGRKPRAFVDPTAFGDWPYLFFVGGCFAVFLGIYTPFVYIQSYALEQEIISRRLCLYMLPILNSSSILGRILPVFLAQRVGPMNMIILTSLMLGVTSLSLIAATTLPRLLTTVLFHGFFTGTFFALQPTIFVRLTEDPQKIGTRLGMAFSGMSIALLFGPPISGALRREKGYDAAWIWAGLCIVAGGLFITTARIWKRNGLLRSL